MTTEPATRNDLSAAYREILGRELGPELRRLLETPGVLNFGVNADGRLWHEAQSTGLVLSEQLIDNRRIRSLLATLASYFERRLDEQHPILDVELPFDGSRVSGMIPPIVPAATVTVRRHSGRILPLENYLERDLLSVEQYEVLLQAIAERRNILVSGGTGSGKTTFANALLAKMVERWPEARFFLIEDTLELQCAARNRVSTRTQEPHVSMRDLVRKAMRERPDRIIIGEVRGAEALDLLKAWNTGHPGGIATIHANSADSALLRLDSLTQEAGVPSQAALIASVVERIVQLEPIGRVVEVVTPSAPR